jgi:hypothetical protein
MDDYKITFKEKTHDVLIESIVGILAGMTGRFIDNITILLMDNRLSLPNLKILK